MTFSVENSKNSVLAGSKKKILVVVIPVFNEAECIDELVHRLLLLKERLDRVETAFVFVNDGSTDDSLDMLAGYAERHRFVRIVNLSKNFGHQTAITAGMDLVDADYVAVIDADLQDPPELIEKMLAKSFEGYDVVYARRRQRRGESFFKVTSARFFYFLLNKFCNIEIPSNAGDFRIVNRKVLVEFRKMREKHRFIRGIIPWIGFSSYPVDYDREKRFAGETKYPFLKMVRFASDAIFSFSIVPLRLATFLGLFVAFLGVVGILFIISLLVFYDNYIPGVSAALFAILLIGGIQLIMTGILGEYIGRIYEESKKRPLYVVDKRINFDEAPSE